MLHRLAVRVMPDRYMLLLVATALLAFVLPARGNGRVATDVAVTVAVTLLFFLYGARLAPSAIWSGLTHWRLQSLVFASTYLLFPLFGLTMAFLASRSGMLPDTLSDGLLFLSLLPSTVQSSIAFTSIARGNVPAALCSASLSNLIGVALTPMLVALCLGQATGGVSVMQAQLIAAQILLPFLAGQAARPLIGNIIVRYKFLTSMVDRGSILLVVYSAFSAGVVAGIWKTVSGQDLGAVLLADAILLSIVLMITTRASLRLGFAKEDEIAVVFCGSKKSMASGIPMATILFPQASVSLIVFPLMLFHQMQLLVCAMLARRYADREEAENANLVASDAARPS